MEVDTELPEMHGHYDPLKWPPDLALAKIHMKCSSPGKDNTQGMQCLCCGRYQKVKTNKWYKRMIDKDFKAYGGGIPCYFQLLKYCGLTLIILIFLVNIYHIYVVQTVCAILEEQQSPNQCQQFLQIVKFCDPVIIYNTLVEQERLVQATLYFYLQLTSFIYLALVTIGMKWWLQRVNAHKITKEEKLYSNYSLIIKNIPKYYTIQDLRKHICLIMPQVQLCQLFFVFEMQQLDDRFKTLFDLHFEIEYVRESIFQNRGETEARYDQLLEMYVQLFDKVKQLKKKIGQNNGRAIAVFNNQTQRNQIRKKLKLTEFNRFSMFSMQLFDANTQKLSMVADKINEPQQILWKYIGQSSATKAKVRIQTSLIGIGYMLVAFGILYFPIIKINEAKINHKSAITTFLGIGISLVLQVLAITYRKIIIKLLPRRRPSSTDSQSYFVVISTVAFHFFFYIVAPVSFYILVQDIPNNIKMKQLFIAVLTFLIISVTIASIDLRYRFFNSARKRILKSWKEWAKYCQLRLHEQLRWPSFPIEYKLMVILNIWSFNAFYIFLTPYLLVLFVVAISLIYWIDKRNIYHHYKMQTYQSIELELSVQKSYIYLFLVCLCAGYAACAIYTWQYYLAIAIFLISIIINRLVSYSIKQKQVKSEAQSTLAQSIQKQGHNVKQSMLQTIIEQQMKEVLAFLQNHSTISVGSTIQGTGYKDRYDFYLNYFKNKTVNSLLNITYEYYKHRKGQVHSDQHIEEHTSTQRKMTNLSDVIKVGHIQGDQKHHTNQQKPNEFLDEIIKEKKQQIKLQAQAKHNQQIQNNEIDNV